VGGFNGAKMPDAQAGYEAANTIQATINASVNFNLHTAGWLEGGLCMSYEKFIMDADQAGMMRVSAEGIDMSENGQAMDAIREIGSMSDDVPKHFLGLLRRISRRLFICQMFLTIIVLSSGFKTAQEILQ